MNLLKKWLGIIWILMGPLVIYLLITGAITHVNPNGKKEINNPVIWVIIISIFLPIVIGFMIFGYYAFKDEYAHLPESSDEIQN